MLRPEIEFSIGVGGGWITAWSDQTAPILHKHISRRAIHRAGGGKGNFRARTRTEAGSTAVVRRRHGAIGRSRDPTR